MAARPAITILKGVPLEGPRACPGLDPGSPLYEAPASVNAKLTIAGRDVQLTLRDYDEVRLLARLEEVLQRYPAPASPSFAHVGRPTPPPADAAPQCPQHGTLKASTKGKGWYCPHKNADGTWCATKA